MVSRNSHVMSYCNELAQFARFCLGSTHFGLFGVFPPVRFAVEDIRLSLGFPLRVSVWVRFIFLGEDGSALLRIVRRFGCAGVQTHIGLNAPSNRTAIGERARISVVFIDWLPVAAADH